VSTGQGKNGTVTCVKNTPADRSGCVESDQDQEGAEGEKDVSTSDSDNENDGDEFHDLECNPLE